MIFQYKMLSCIHLPVGKNDRFETALIFVLPTE